MRVIEGQPGKIRYVDGQMPRRELLSGSVRVITLEGFGKPLIPESEIPKPVMTHIYFGDPKKEDMFPLNGTIRLSFPSDKRAPTDLMFLDPAQACDLEIDYPAPHFSDSQKPDGHFLLKGLALGEAIGYLGENINFDRLAEIYHNDEVANILKRMLDGFGAKPLFMMQGERSTLSDATQGNLDITLDSDNTYWTINQRKDFDVWCAVRTDFPGANILTVTGDSSATFDYQQTIQSLFGIDNDYKRNDSTASDTGQAVLAARGRPELQKYDLEKEGEKEIKIDLTSNPQAVVKALPVQLAEGIFLGPSYPRTVNYFQCIVVPGGIITLKCVSPNFDRPTAYQFKAPAESGEYLTRKKVTRSSLPELLDEIGVARRDLPRTAIGQRDRVDRTVVVADTKNVFAILADHCTGNDGRLPLDQIEIEYIGKFDLQGNKEPVNNEERERDFKRIRRALEPHLQKNNIQVLDTQTTKFEWISQPVLQLI